MCGIIGSFEPNRRQPFDESERERMIEARDQMTTRGPDGAGLWADGRTILGHRRLAILDLSVAGAQPMVAASGVALTFNGEIYNYVELRDELRRLGVAVESSGDTAVLLAAYERWGLVATLKRLRGMFAFAIWDPGAGQLHLARDPVGKKPLFVADHAGGVAFASTIGALRSWLPRGADLRLDPVAVEHLLVGGYVPAPRTIYRGVSKLAAGTWLTVGLDGERTGAAHYTPPIGRGDRRLNATTIAELDAQLDTAVARRLRSDVPVATFLSGGLDSSLVTACAAAKQPGITAYTVRTGHDNEDEFALAKAIAKHTGATHRVVELPTLTDELIAEFVKDWPEPLCDSSMLPSWLVAKVTARDFRVVLTGDGGDELHGGYGNSTTFALRRWSRRLAPATLLDAPLCNTADGLGRGAQVAFKLARLFASAPAAVGLRHDRLDHAVRDLIDPRHHGLLAQQGWTAEWTRRFMTAPTDDELERMQAADFSVYLPDDLLMKVDGATMAHSLEARAPLLDLDFVNAAWAVRSHDRTRPWASKRIIRALFDRRLPKKLRMRRKHGFSVPVAEVFTADVVRERLLQADRGELPGLGEVFAPGAFATALRSPGMTGPDKGELVWRLWMLAEWAAGQR